ncbi:MAG: hypothetical protein JO234_10215 [Hyphomicrobiales bacterium]|nr:hypothetical protein [Hyphomicrobiales bacterium]
MLRQSLGRRENAGTRPQHDLLPWRRRCVSGERRVEAGEMRRSDRAVALRYRGERRLEVA